MSESEWRAEKDDYDARKCDDECRSLADELGVPLCNVRWLEGRQEPDVYMAGGAWLSESMVRGMKEEQAT